MGNKEIIMSVLGIVIVTTFSTAAILPKPVPCPKEVVNEQLLYMVDRYQKESAAQTQQTKDMLSKLPATTQDSLKLIAAHNEEVKTLHEELDKVKATSCPQK